jgi:cellobiose phosphorylase
MRDEVNKAIEAKAWDGTWYLHAVAEDGSTLGSSKHDEGSLSLNSQTWAVFSGSASADKARSAMDAVHERLASEYGVSLLQPPFTKPRKGFSLSLLVFPPGHKENGGIFCHANSWAIIAESLLGRGDIAYDYWKAYAPSHYNERAELRQVEPYVYCQFTHAKNSPRFGQSRNPWLTGTASWTYIALTQYILGLRPAEKGLLIDPCIPSAWKGFKTRRVFRGKVLNITVENPKGSQKGVQSLTLNGEKLSGNLVPADKLKDQNTVIALLG